MVEAGQVLAKMDTNEQEAELAKDKAKLAESEEAAATVKTEITKEDSQLKLAEVEFGRSKSLLQRRVIAQEEYDRYKTRLDTAKASLEGAKAKLKTANQSINAAAAEVKRTEVRIDDATLKSPVRGRVLYRLAEPAEVVSLGGKILTLVNMSDVYMEMYLPAQEVLPTNTGLGETASLPDDLPDALQALLEKKPPPPPCPMTPQTPKQTPPVPTQPMTAHKRRTAWEGLTSGTQFPTWTCVRPLHQNPYQTGDDGTGVRA